MANVTRVRVELRNKYRDPQKNFKEMMHKFRRYVSDAGIISDYKEHQVFVSKSEKKRKKKREAVAKAKEEQIEEQILSGQKVTGNGRLVKKIMARHFKKKKNNNKQRDNRGRDYRDRDSE